MVTKYYVIHFQWKDWDEKFEEIWISRKSSIMLLHNNQLRGWRLWHFPPEPRVILILKSQAGLHHLDTMSQMYIFYIHPPLTSSPTRDRLTLGANVTCRISSRVSHGSNQRLRPLDQEEIPPWSKVRHWFSSSQAGLLHHVTMSNAAQQCTHISAPTMSLT